MPSKSEAGVVMTGNLVIAISSAWKKIRELHPDVPQVVLTIGSGTLGAKKGTLHLGHFAAGRWQTNGEKNMVHPELFVGGEGLKLGATELLATLIHEATHGLAHTRKIQDTSRQGRYHNDKFRELAEEMELAVEKVGSIGWSQTTLAAGVEHIFAKELALLEKALTAYRMSEHEAKTAGNENGEGEGETEEKKNSNNIKCVCACEKPRIIRISKSVLELGAIECKVCEKEFAPAETA